MEVAAILDLVLKVPQAARETAGTGSSKASSSPSKDFAAMLAERREGTQSARPSQDEETASKPAKPDPDAADHIADEPSPDDSGEAIKEAVVAEAAIAPCANTPTSAPTPAPVPLASETQSGDTPAAPVQLTDTVLEAAATQPVSAETSAPLVTAVDDPAPQTTNVAVSLAALEEAVAAVLADESAATPTVQDDGARFAKVLMQLAEGKAGSSANAPEENLVVAASVSANTDEAEFVTWLKSQGFDVETPPEPVKAESPPATISDRVRPSVADKKAAAPDAQTAAGIAPVQDASVSGTSTVAASAGPAREQATLAILDQVALRGVRYLVSQQEKTVSIHLVPPSLGELRIEVTAAQDGMHVRLMSSNPAVRETLEGQLAGLQESLARNGIEVAKVSVIQNMAGYAANQQFSQSSGTANYSPVPVPRAAFASLQAGAESSVAPIQSKVSLHEGALNVYV